jgi:hypothetical protein
MILWAHLASSLPKAEINLWAEFNLLAHFSASAIEAFLSATALSNSAVKEANYSFNSLTTISTSANLMVASASYSSDSLRAFLLGSTS